MYLATKIILGIALALLFWAIINFVSNMGTRRREVKELRELQELKEKNEAEGFSSD